MATKKDDNGGTLGSSPDAPNYGIGPRGLGTEAKGTYGQSSSTGGGGAGTATTPTAPKAGAGFYGAGSTKGQENTLATAQPTEQQDINQILAPYIKELTSLGPEYQKEMEYLAPYLGGTGAQTPQTFDQIVAGSKADESSTGSKAVNAADAAAGNAYLNAPPPGFGGLANAAKSTEGSVPSEQAIANIIQYNKSAQAYSGEQTGTTGWTPAQIAAYTQALGTAPSGGASQGGLPAPTSAALSYNASVSPTTSPGNPNNTGG